MVKTINLTAGAVHNVQFSATYPYYWIDNKGTSAVYASIGTPVADSDGTYTIEAGTQMRIPAGMSGGINLLGEGKVQIIATDSAFSPFKFRAKGGEEGHGETIDYAEYEMLITEPIFGEIEEE